MSFLFETGSPLKTVESIEAAIEHLIDTKDMKKESINVLQMICLDKLETSGKVTWEFILETLSELINEGRAEPGIYNSIISRQRKNHTT